ncbi:hypothetical protein ABVT39_027924 [Epinephelus coioides]
MEQRIRCPLRDAGQSGSFLPECVCVTGGDRGRCRRAGNVRDDTHAAHAGRSRLGAAPLMFITGAASFLKGVIRMSELLNTPAT